MLVCKTGEITPHDLPESIREEGRPAQEFTIPPHRTLAEIEKMAILQTLQRTNWNKQEAAQILGCTGPRSTAKALQVRPLRTRPVGGQLEPVAVRIRQVDRLGVP